MIVTALVSMKSATHFTALLLFNYCIHASKALLYLNTLLALLVFEIVLRKDEMGCLEHSLDACLAMTGGLS